ncbi:hypothetical protein ACWPKS_15870 [Coraliomargarita sp. W4R72]
MPSTAKYQSKTSPSCSRSAVCFRSSGFTHTTRVVDGVALVIVRFSVDHGKFVEIALSESLALGLGADLRPQPIVLPAATVETPRVDTLTPPSRGQGSCAQDRSAMALTAFAHLEADPAMSLSACAELVGHSASNLGTYLRQYDADRYAALHIRSRLALRRQQRGDS